MNALLLSNSLNINCGRITYHNIDYFFFTAKIKKLINSITMSIKNVINNYHFESISLLEAEKVKNGIFDYSSISEIKFLEQDFLLTAELLEYITQQHPEKPHNFLDILNLFIVFKAYSKNEVQNVFSSKNTEDLYHYYSVDPLLVSLIDVICQNLNNNINIYNFLKETELLCRKIATESSFEENHNQY